MNQHEPETFRQLTEAGRRAITRSHMKWVVDDARLEKLVAEHEGHKAGIQSLSERLDSIQERLEKAK